ncbi:MAG: hypothetical protein JXB35_01290 [Anaerolineae bacterium]|nr:hypothetical protein [Anaerolineae bacterium]
MALNLVEISLPLSNIEIGKAKSSIAKIIAHAKSNGFYEEWLVKWMLFTNDFTSATRGEKKFIDYGNWVDYYLNDSRYIEFTQGVEDTRKKVRLPYQELINFLGDNRHTRIYVDNSPQNYIMNRELSNLTQRNLEAYCQAKPHTTPGPIVRLASLQKIDNDHYRCRLERANYFDQVRTNLTLDYPLQTYPETTLRTRDLDSDNNLKPFEESALVNSIGVSAVVYYESSDGQKHFFMKVRRETQGVFEKAFGTVSGAAEWIHGADIPELRYFATREVLREFRRETGFEDDNEFIEFIAPLALTRELIRGGKPQFFFLIKIKDPFAVDTTVPFSERFGKSEEGAQEFKEKKLSFSKITSSLSPELATNLVYTFEYFQSIARIPQEPVNL